MADEIIARAEARAKGLKRYFTGEPCSRGHIAERSVSGKCCVVCRRINNAERLANDPEKLEKAREATRNYMRRWRAENPEEVKERLRSHYWSDPEMAREYARQTYDRLKDKKVAAKREERRKNPGVYRLASKRYYEKNTDKYRVWSRNYKVRKRGAEGFHTAADIKAIVAAQSYKCAYCRVDLRKVKNHLDHIMPLARGGANDRRNLQVTCESCNLSKSDRDPIEFAQQMGRLL